MAATTARPLLLFLLGLVAVVCPVAAASDSEVLGWLRGYLRIDSSNPPGDETSAAAFLAAILHQEGIATETQFSHQLRPNLIARIEGSDSSLGALVLLHHLDVVPPGDGWTRAPFEAEVKDGHVWGRGAIDSKSLGIAHLAAFIDLARSGRTPARDVVFLATADEEAGGGQGVAFLLAEQREKLGPIAGVLTEGGANQVYEDRLVWWGIEAVQKRPLWLRLEANGRAGHGSSYNPSSASHQLIEALGRLLDIPQPMRISEAGHRFFHAVAPLHGSGYRQVFGHPSHRDAQAALDSAAANERLHEARIPSIALLVDTIQVTTFDNDNRSINAVPHRARATVDVRLLPDTDQQVFLQRAREILGDRIEIEVLLEAPTQPVPRIDDWLFRQLEASLEDSGPVVPAFISGTTDARYFRQLGIPTYGFSPFLLTSAEYRGVHGADESIAVGKLERGVARMIAVVRECANAEPSPGSDSQSSPPNPATGA